MNFYTLTFKPKRWIFLLFVLSFVVSAVIFSVNFIVDPYNITKYNLLHIKYKFARDDRTEKTNYFSSLNKVDNILIGSSRVYSMNPQTVSNLLGGTTYNFGVGTATVEDHLGILLYLKKAHKLPKNLIIGVDFYTFNPDIPTNNYFLANKQLNFLSYSNYKEDYLAKFFSIDAFRASFKTLNNHLTNKNEKPRFDKNGWAGAYEDYSKRNIELDAVNTKKEILENKKIIYSNFEYKNIDPKRVAYYEQIKALCKENHITLYIFPTPLNPMLLKILKDNKNTNNALNEFIKYLATFSNFYNTFEDQDIYNDIRNFHGSTHTSANAGDIILKNLLIRP
jgi:hypothetical protein